MTFFSKPKNVLYVFDESTNIRNVLHKLRTERGKVILTPLTNNEKCISYVFQSIGSLRKNENVLIPFSRVFNEKAFSIRDGYIKFIYEFGEIKTSEKKNLKKYFKPFLGNFSTWWFSLIAGKNPLKTNSFHNLVKLLTILDLQKKYNCKKVFVDIENPTLISALMDNMSIENCEDFRKHKKRIEVFYILFLIGKTIKGIISKYKKTLWVKIVMRGLNLRKKILQNSKYLVVTYFPLVDKNALKDKKFINKYYEPLQKALREKHGDRLTWLAMVVKNEDFNYNEGILLGKEISKWGDSLFFYEEWLNLFDFFLVTLEFLYTSLKFLIKRSFIANQFNFQNVKIWEIFKEDWYISFSGNVLEKGLFYHRAFSRIFNRLKEDTTIIYLAENHSWEKALNIACHKRKDLKTVGIQHTTVPLLLLNYFNYEKELGKGDYIQKMPKPDYLGCVGEISYELFKKSGWDEKQLFILGALRFQYIKNCPQCEIPWGGKENKIVVALSIMPEESKEILLYVNQAFKNISGYKVIIKGHPFLDVQKLVTSLNLKFDDRIFQIVRIPLSKLLPKAKCLIVTQSSSALEGIASGCVVIIPYLANIVDMNPLSGISDLPIYVENSRELARTVNEVMKRDSSPYPRDKCKALVEQYFDFPSVDEDFLERLEKK